MTTLDASSKNFISIVRLNQLVKKFYSKYIIYPTGRVIGYDDSRVIENCRMYIESDLVDKIYEDMPYSEGAAIMIDAQILFDATSKKKTEINGISLDGEMNLTVHKLSKEGVSSTFEFGKYILSDEASAINMKYTIDEPNIHWTLLSDVERSMILDKEAIELTNGYNSVTVAKSLMPIISKTDISYGFIDIDDQTFGAFIQFERERVRIITAYDCFIY